MLARAVEFQFDGHDAALKIAQQLFLRRLRRGMGEGLAYVPRFEPVRCGGSPTKIRRLARRAERVGCGRKVAFPIEWVNRQPVHGLACDRIYAAALQDLVDACEPFGFGRVGKPAAQRKEIICHGGDLVRTGGPCELLTEGQGRLVA